MNAWSHLPNAHLIDWVLESVKNNPDSWRSAYDAYHATRDARRAAAYDAVWNTTRDALWNAARDAAWDAVARETVGAARGAARDSILALVAYDDCDQYLDMTYEQLKVYALLSERPQAVLLLPLKWVQEQQSVAA